MNLVDFDVFNLPNNDNLLVSGDNAKNILVLYKKGKNESEQLDFLKKVLNAIKIDIQKDILLVGMTPEQKLSLSALLKNYTTNIVLLFGLEKNKLGINFEVPNYFILKLQNIQFLTAHSLGSIMVDGTKKRKLWNNLKLLEWND